ncbi:WD40 repeat-like protein [Imleria badia]|nr:WD40 repeat-like protein [Imleria badia]
MSSGVIQQRSDNAGFRPQLVISAHDKSITTLAYLPDGRRVVTGSGDGTVRVCPLENGKQVAAEKQEHRVGSLAVTRDGTKIVSSNDDGNIKVWDLESQKLVKEWTHPEIWPEIAISPDDQFIASGCWTVAIYTMEGRQVNHSIAVGDVVWSMAFSPDGKKLACTTHDDIRVYDVHSGKIILGPLQGHEDHVRCVLWSRDGSKLFSSSHDCTIRCWNSDTGEQIGHPWTGHTGHIRALSLSPDGSILASASFDQTVRFWDVASELPIGQHLRHDTEVCAVCFSPSGDFLASSGWNGSVYLWPAPSLNPIKDWASTTLPSVRHSEFRIHVPLIGCLAPSRASSCN